MRRSNARTRALSGFVLISVIGLGGLLLAAAVDRRPVAFSLNEQLIRPLATITRGQSACEGPIAAQSAFAGIRAFIGTDPPSGGTLTLLVRSPAGATLSARDISARGGNSTYTVGLGRTIAAGATVDVCLRNSGSFRAAFFGAARADRHVTLTIAGRRTTDEASLLFLTPHPPTLLGDLPTLFARAALFRPGWVGVWTFWLLLAGLLVAFVLVGRALVSAAAADSV